MKLKKVCAMLMATVMVFGFAACGGNDSGKGGTAGANADLDWTAGADASGGNVTLRVGTWRTSDQPYYEEIIKRFEEKYDWIEVELEVSAQSDTYYSNLQADLASGTGPDLFDFHPDPKLINYIEEGMIAPQTDFAYMANYNDNAKAITTINGENYAFMNAYNYFGFLYNKSIFSDLGLSVPTTPEEFVDVVNKVKKAGYGGVIYAGKTYGKNIGGAMQLISLGSDKYAEMQQKIDNGTLTDLSEVEGMPEAYKTIQYYVENNIFYNAWESIAYEAGLSLFAQEKSPIIYSGSYMFGEKDNYIPNVDTGFFAIPTYANTGLSFAEGAQMTCINARSKNLGAAKLWVEFISTSEISEYFCSNVKMLSTINGVTPTFEEAQMLNDAATGYAMSPLTSTEHGEYWQTGFKNITEGIFEGEDWEALVRAFASKLEEYDLSGL